MAQRKINFGKIFSVISKVGIAGLMMFGLVQCLRNEASEMDMQQKMHDAVRHRDDGVDYRVRGAHVVEADYPDQTLTYNFDTQSVLIEHKENSTFDRLVTFAELEGHNILREAFENGCRIAQEEMIPLGEDTQKTYKKDRAEISEDGRVFVRNYCPQP